MPAKPTFSAGAAALAVVARASAPPHREWGPGTRPSGPRSDLGHWESAEPTSLAEEEAGAKSSSAAAKGHRSPGVGAGDPSLGAQIGLGALGVGGANFLGGGGGGGEEQFGGGQVASATGGTTGDILGAIKAALSVGKTLQQAFDLFGGGAPGSFAMSDTTRSAFEAQRAGERQDFSSFLGGGAATSPMLDQLGAGPLGGANVPWETFAGPGTTFSN